MFVYFSEGIQGQCVLTAEAQQLKCGFWVQGMWTAGVSQEVCAIILLLSLQYCSAYRVFAEHYCYQMPVSTRMVLFSRTIFKLLINSVTAYGAFHLLRR